LNENNKEYIKKKKYDLVILSSPVVARYFYGAS